jgi:hypothetical protein
MIEIPARDIDIKQTNRTSVPILIDMSASGPPDRHQDRLRGTGGVAVAKSSKLPHRHPRPDSPAKHHLPTSCGCAGIS